MLLISKMPPLFLGSAPNVWSRCCGRLAAIIWLRLSLSLSLDVAFGVSPARADDGASPRSRRLASIYDARSGAGGGWGVGAGAGAGAGTGTGAGVGGGTTMRGASGLLRATMGGGGAALTGG